MIRSMLSRGCRVSFFGVGRSNLSLMRHLPLSNCKVTVRSDTKIIPSALPDFIRFDRIYEGGACCYGIDEEIIFFSPSVRRDRPELIRARDAGVIFTSDLELFLEENKKPIFAVTGSDGKSTTASMMHSLLTTGGTTAALVGNIGEPMAEYLGADVDLYVMELSSFMLSYATVKARRGCITNITPNHLDWHRDFSEYKKTKITLVKSSDEFVISENNSDISGAYAIVGDKSGYKELVESYKAELYITKEDGYILKNGERILTLDDVLLKERHNIKNLMSSIAMTDGYVGNDEIRAVARSFCGLGHRCQRIFSAMGVDYYDSSIDSTPARTAQTLSSLNRDSVIILGGRGKGVGYDGLKSVIRKYARHAIIVGENSGEIYEAIKGCTKCEVHKSFENAVTRGASLARDVGTLLLSPASTSYDMFKNYAEKGDKFKEIILKIHHF